MKKNSILAPASIMPYSRRKYSLRFIPKTVFHCAVDQWVSALALVAGGCSILTCKRPSSIFMKCLGEVYFGNIINFKFCLIIHFLSRVISNLMILTRSLLYKQLLHNYYRTLKLLHEIE